MPLKIIIWFKKKNSWIAYFEDYRKKLYCLGYLISWFCQAQDKHIENVCFKFCCSFYFIIQYFSSGIVSPYQKIPMAVLFQGETGYICGVSAERFKHEQICIKQSSKYWNHIKLFGFILLDIIIVWGKKFSSLWQVFVSV